MRQKSAWLVTSFALGLLALGIHTAARAQEDAAGRTLFVEFGCWQCHGYAGQGGASGPRIAPAPLPYVAFEQIVRKPPNVMPAYPPDALPGEVLQQIYAYLGSIEVPPPVGDIPELR